MYYLNCTGEQNKQCEIQNQNISLEIFGSVSVLVISFIGFVLNMLSLFIFVFSNNMNTKFLNYFKWYLVNSILVTLNLFITMLLHFLLNENPFDKIFLFNKLINIKPTVIYTFTSEFYILSYIFVFLPVWSITYTFGSLLDIIIAYERILLYLPRFKFMRNVKIHIYLIVIFLISFLVNLPPNVSRYFFKFTLNFSRPINTTFDVYYFARRDFGKYNDYFTGFLYASTFFRDICTLVIELIICVCLLITVLNFYNRKRKLKKKRLEKPSKESEQDISDSTIRKTEINNSKIIFLICIISSFNHIGTFLILISLYFYDQIYNPLITTFGLVFLLKHSANFFLFMKLNKKFKNNFMTLMCSKKI